jgi:opacity protein-like surface antigen
LAVLPRNLQAQAGDAQAQASRDQLCYQWIDAATGKQVPTGPPGWDPNGSSTLGGEGSNPDTHHVEFRGHTFVKLSDGTWIDVATGKQVLTGPVGWDPNAAPSYGENGSTPEQNRVEIGGHTFVRVPCPTPPAAPAPTAPPNPTPTFSGLQIGVGGSVGAIGHTTSYDDGYRIGSTGFYGHGFAFVTDGLARDASLEGLYLAAVIGITLPTGTTSQSPAHTQIKAVGTISGELGFQVGKLPNGKPFLVYINAGPAFGVENSGYSSTTGPTPYSYSDTEAMFGFTTGSGLKMPVAPGLNVFAEVNYLRLTSTSFASPGGSYSLGETGLNGSIGVQWTPHKLQSILHKRATGPTSPPPPAPPTPPR